MTATPDGVTVVATRILAPTFAASPVVVEFAELDLDGGTPTTNSTTVYDGGYSSLAVPGRTLLDGGGP